VEPLDAAPTSTAGATERAGGTGRGLRGLPFGLIVVVILQLAAAVWILTGVFGLRTLEGTTFLADALESNQAALYVFGVIGGVQAIAALLLLLRSRLAWLVIMLIMGASLVFGILSYAAGDPAPVRLTLYVVSAFYLNQRPVRAAFGIRYGQAREEVVA